MSVKKTIVSVIILLFAALLFWYSFADRVALCGTWVGEKDKYNGEAFGYEFNFDGTFEMFYEFKGDYDEVASGEYVLDGDTIMLIPEDDDLSKIEPEYEIKGDKLILENEYDDEIYERDGIALIQWIIRIAAILIALVGIILLLV